MRSLELFAGGGGLGLGLHKAGFHARAVVEWDKWSCDTIRNNKALGFPLVQGWKVVQGDAREFDFASVGEVELVSGGPPCQPFSLGGKHRAYEDSRDMFPTAVKAVRELQPMAFIFENVKGITRAAFANYFQYIGLQMAFPELIQRPNETWPQHLARLETRKTSGRQTGLRYNVVTQVLNSANYGIPQVRERVFFVGFRSDLGIEWSFPQCTHSYAALVKSQFGTGAYWERHRVTRQEVEIQRARVGNRLQGLLNAAEADLLPWRTVRDAISDLPDPKSRKARSIANHTFQDGARPYPGHTGSPLDLPAKTLKAGDHGVPGGENMMVLPNDAYRYFTVRESARLQTFPDSYIFQGSWTETMRQLGNAVPVELARQVGTSVAGQLLPLQQRQLMAVRA
ncbi:MAG: DNA cytosine methyltransferase [Flavobacteriales bacterium]|nr:DNA cytosine methyltransferase [Flavobacteriales bacterium]MBK6892676.1 DNA cytosine methyltransferase [Flavobacteriales bacterium]MBK7246817.1 DNA cytosine methyltransferase [Flavobacteriales bacterium]HQX31722.1 DNA cytosine methyltransferase [Flavobacteriales bacterium]